MGRLTTHVLDTAVGKPAARLAVELWRMDGSAVQVASGHTNADGRLDQPILEGAKFSAGTYELRFHVGDYLRTSQRVTGPTFLDVVPIRFSVTSSDEHYHVPLLVSPYGYSTYRGS
jgi:5-hydroxyisourate hydrolase